MYKPHLGLIKLNRNAGASNIFIQTFLSAGLMLSDSWVNFPLLSITVKWCIDVPLFHMPSLQTEISYKMAEYPTAEWKTPLNLACQRDKHNEDHKSMIASINV